MKKIAVIDDDLNLLPLLKYNLESKGFQVVGATTGKAALSLCIRERPDLILLDRMLPDCDGLDIFKRLRGYPEFGSTPIIFLSALASEEDRVLGLELGANDYIVKPFIMLELIARIKLQLRNPADPASLLRAGQLELDRECCQVRLGGIELVLTATEFRLLQFLMAHPNFVFSREELLKAVWGRDRTVTDRTVDVYVLRLRQKIGSDANGHQFIRAVRGFGYSLEVDAQRIRYSETGVMS